MPQVGNCTQQDHTWQEQQYDYSVIFFNDDFHQNSSKSLAEKYLFKSSSALTQALRNSAKPIPRYQLCLQDEWRSSSKGKKRGSTEKASSFASWDSQNPLVEPRFLTRSMERDFSKRTKARNSVVCAHTIQQLSNKPPFLGRYNISPCFLGWPDVFLGKNLGASPTRPLDSRLSNISWSAGHRWKTSGFCLEKSSHSRSKPGLIFLTAPSRWINGIEEGFFPKSYSWTRS